MLERIKHAVLDRGAIRPGDTVVDLGAGTGFLTLPAARAAGASGHVLAVDSSSRCLEMLCRAARSAGGGRITPVHADLTDIPVDSSSCDVAVSRSALIYADDVVAAVAEMARILKPGGRYSVFEPLAAEIAWQTGGALGEMEEVFREIERVVGRERAARGMDRRGLREAFARSGLVKNQTLAVQYPIIMGGEDAGQIAREYLFDLPAGLATFEIAKRSMEERSVRQAARAFARGARAGEVSGTIVCMFAWGRAAQGEGSRVADESREA